MKISIETFGCTSNRADSLKMEAILKQKGHVITNSDPEIVILNTCCVTKHTENAILKRLKNLRLQNKEIIIAGCLPASNPELFRGYRFVTPANIGDIGKLLNDADIKIQPEIAPVAPLTGITGIVNISTGCVGDCSYCIVKSTRGRLKSVPPDIIAESVRACIKAGAKEIHITAQDTGAYGMDIGYRLNELIDRICRIAGDFNIRIGMMTPATAIGILDELIESFEDPKVYKFLHLPIQSGSDKVLLDMKRNHTVSDYIRIVETFRQRFPEMTFSTDFIVGYPAESEEDFRQTLNILYETRPIKVNITRFSPRPGTDAYGLKDMPDRFKKERSRILTEAHHEITREYNKSWIGKTVPVLVTEQGQGGSVIARDPSYKNITLQERLALGSRHMVRITGIKHTYLTGKTIR